MDRAQKIWDERYAKALAGDRNVGHDPWIAAWLSLAPQATPQRALDIGCGHGHNVRLLTDRGIEATAIDFSEHALELCRRTAPGAKALWADVREPLPFPLHSFEIVVADLSLHYFRLEATGRTVAEIARCLVESGLFLGRFNSVKDRHYGADSGAVPGDDPNLRLVAGQQKRFFTRACLEGLFTSPWEIVQLEEKETTRFGPAKVFWEILATKNR